MKPIISNNIRLRYPEFFEIGEDSIVDDFSYFSARIRVGRGSHLASRLTIGGGTEHQFSLGDYSGIAAGSCIYLSSSDYVRGLITPAARSLDIHGDVIFDNYTGLGCNSMVMPDNYIPEGTAIGALSFVPSRFPFEPWTVYAGNPCRAIKARDRDSVLLQLAEVQDEEERAFYLWRA